jgi:hypothetical protein
VTWTNVFGGDWDTATNWDAGHVPTASDDAVVDMTGITVTHNTTAADTAQSLMTRAAFTISAGSLALASDSAFQSSLNLSGGVLTGAGDVSVGGLLAVTAGGTMSGTGVTVVAGGMAMSGRLLLTGRTVVNTGPANVTGAGTLTMGGGAVFVNLDSGTLDVQHDTPFNAAFGGGVFVNLGTLRKSAGNGPVSIDFSFVNEGMVEVDRGTLTVAGNGSSSGSFVVQTGATLNLTALAYSLDPGSTVTGAGDVFFSGRGAITVAGTVAVGAITVTGTTVNLAGADMTSTGGVQIRSGALTGSGTIHGDLQNSGVVSPGEDGVAGVLIVTGDYTQTAAGVLNIALGGPDPDGPYDQLQIGGSATLDGTLNVGLIGGYTPQPGDTFGIVTFASATGNFATLNGVDLGGGLSLDPSYNDTDLTLVTTQH